MNRDESLEKINGDCEFDFIIIGGGATGLGCAVDAASRGFKTLLLERSDFAKGTSSRATKLVHGGVRYLAQGNIRLVKEALLERGRLLRNAPHICHTLPFVLPTFNYWQKFYYGFGLWLYEFLSGKLSLGKTKLLSKKETLNFLPDLSHKKLTGGILYFDGQFDDSRLAIALAQTAVEQGAVVINYCTVNDFLKTDKKISGVIATDEINKKEFKIKAKAVINATGVFADKLLQLADSSAKETIAPSQGIHLVVNQKFFRAEKAMMIPKTDDGRVLFAIPWQEKLLLGTTDTAIEKITAEPKALQEEIDFIVNHFNRYNNTKINRGDITSIFVGLRPLAKQGSSNKTAIMPRDHVIKVLDSGLVHITGGKWTTYRSMAEHCIDKAIEVAKLNFVPAKTKELKLYGYLKTNNKNSLSCYGSKAKEIELLIENDNSLREKIHPSYPYCKAEVKYHIDNEMAMTIEDILARRTRLLFLDAKASMEAASVVVEMFNNSSEWKENQLQEFYTLAKSYLV